MHSSIPSEFNVDLKDFQIIKSLGTGSYGQAYLIEQKNTKKQYVAKVFNQECSESQKKSFSNGISSFLTFQSPAILKFIGFSLTNFDEKNYPTIVTEYMPNGSLGQIIEEESLGKRPKNWNTHKKYINILGIALAMQYLHSKGIINRDLQPSNILLDENMYPQVGDFSTYKLIKVTSNKFKESDTCSSIYTAPEVIFKDKYTNKADVYSFAFIAYEIILGRPIKLPNDDLPTLLKDINNGKRPDLSIIAAPAVKEFLAKCWDKEPSKRPSFDQMIQFIGNSDFFDPFNIDKNEVINYVNLFPDNIKGKKYILNQLNESILEDKERINRIHKNKSPLRMFVILIITIIIYTFIKQTFLQ